MTSWRDSVSIEAQGDLDGLLSAALSAAQEAIASRGEFYPFAVSLSAEGDQVLNMTSDQVGEHPESSDVVSALVAGLQAERARLRAAAIAADVMLESGDAVRVQIEHREGVAIAAFLPYQRKRFGRAVTYGELSAAADVRRIWLEQGA
jgi:hypothetical protein